MTTDDKLLLIEKLEREGITEENKELIDFCYKYKELQNFTTALKEFKKVR